MVIFDEPLFQGRRLYRGRAMHAVNFGRRLFGYGIGRAAVRFSRLPGVSFPKMAYNIQYSSEPLLLLRILM